MLSLPRFRDLFIAAVLALGAVSMLGTAGTAAAQTVDEPPIETAATLVAAPREPVMRGPGSELQIDVQIDNPGQQQLPEGTVRLEVDPRPLASIEDLDGVFPEHPVELGEAEIGPTAPDSEQSLTITVPQDRLPFTSTTPSGVYLLRASIAPDLEFTVPLAWESSAGTRSDPATAASVRLGLIVPIVLPDDIRTLPTRPQLEELVPGWSDLLDQARSAEATLAIDPRVIAGIRAYGDEAPEPARQFLARLEATPLPNFLLQFADADPSAQADLGFTSLLQPTSLDFVSRFGSAASETPPRDETAGSDSSSESSSDSGADGADGAAGQGSDDTTGTDAAPPLPTLDELLSWNEAEPMAWPAEGSADQGTLELLRLSNIDSVVLDSENVDRASGGPRVSLEQGSAIVTDAALADAARTALSASGEVERAAGLSRLSAYLLLAAQSGSEDLVLGLDRGATADAQDPALLIAQLRELGWVEPTAIGALDEGEALLRGSDTLEERRELLRAAVGRESSVSELGAVLVHPEYLSGYQRARLLELFATRHAAPGVAFEEVAARYQKRDAELLQGVQGITTERMQLVGASTRVPVQLHNSLPFEASVDVQVVPASAVLSVTEPHFSGVLVPPEGNERVLVPVNSRVSSGESGLVVTVGAASGDLTVFTGTLAISVRSGVETIALTTLGILAALLLGFGIWRSVRRRRAASAARVTSLSE
ncbi:DUF6049 family protein [Leucobacter tenebrionis]|uniref:DUF6049 family protein n=1 Tax=Leucobacter tenebrionis TaxID=2873270 RepID=UPI001CA70965|nr:DUF6049 family protein [Leucobacter tenebrionis]QZY50829.1 DUF6049 family protein [Leucobacter tenebrionis]